MSRPWSFENPNGARWSSSSAPTTTASPFATVSRRARREHTVTGETTGFRLPRAARSGPIRTTSPRKYTPAYETYYVNGVAVGTPSPSEAGWAFPVLFCNADRSRWGLVTEAGVDESYCGCRLAQNAPDGRLPDPIPRSGRGRRHRLVEPSWTLPWATPWRVIMRRRLARRHRRIDPRDGRQCPPSVVKDTSWIKPGRASWSWLFDHDSPQDCTKLKALVDLAAEMGWEYSLVDANWDLMKNGTIHDLIAYANSKGVGLLLWYNSGGPHNLVTEKPRGLMDHRGDPPRASSSCSRSGASRASRSISSRATSRTSSSCTTTSSRTPPSSRSWSTSTAARCPAAGRGPSRT